MAGGFEVAEAELRMVQGANTKTVGGHGHVWFIISEAWLAQWREYATKKCERRPGPISNASLFVGGSQSNAPKIGLKPKHDFRGVNWQVWGILRDLYGCDFAVARTKVRRTRARACCAQRAAQHCRLARLLALRPPLCTTLSLLASLSSPAPSSPPLHTVRTRRAPRAPPRARTLTHTCTHTRGAHARTSGDQVDLSKAFEVKDAWERVAVRPRMRVIRAKMHRGIIREFYTMMSLRVAVRRR
jgi:hypothetical protein